MATHTVRGSSHNIVYVYRIGKEKKQVWETYQTELEAVQRKSFIDYLQRNKMIQELDKAAAEYRKRRAVERAVEAQFAQAAETPSEPSPDATRSNLQKTYREFAEKWLPIHVRKKSLAPNTFDSYRENLDTHILPYFGDWVMSEITAEAIDEFIDYLTRKPCRCSKAGNQGKTKKTLSSSSVKKAYTVLTAGFDLAKAWGYITEIPKTTPPAEKNKKRRAIMADRTREILDSIQDDKLLHLVVHFAFVNSMRAGEIAGIDIGALDFNDGSLWLCQQIQRVSDESLKVLSEDAVLRVFPKQLQHSKSALVLKGPKSGISTRKLYLTRPLIAEIQERLQAIEENKQFFGSDYHDYGLLICYEDGRPIEPNRLERQFKQHQRDIGIPEDQQIELQGLRKSGEMHKVRLTKNNFQLVAESGGHSPEVLMSHYNEALDSEKREMYRLVERSFYDQAELEPPSEEDQATQMLDQLRQNPAMLEKLMQMVLLNSLHAQKGV